MPRELAVWLNHLRVSRPVTVTPGDPPVVAGRPAARPVWRALALPPPWATPSTRLRLRSGPPGHILTRGGSLRCPPRASAGS
ncbi:MAG: hypothetical protein ACR2ML_12130 [Solirubrobacteraceae bacterium]